MILYRALPKKNLRIGTASSMKRERKKKVLYPTIYNKI